MSVINRITSTTRAAPEDPNRWAEASASFIAFLSRGNPAGAEKPRSFGRNESVGAQREVIDAAACAAPAPMRS